MARRLATAVLTLGCMHASVVAALGLGELKLESFLNEPLSASVDLLNTSGLHEEQIRVRLATSEDFDKLGIDRVYFLTSIEFEISVDERGNGKITLSSEDPVLEPYLDFIIEARWPTGRLLREYTVLVDSPAFNSSNPVVSASQRVIETEGDPQAAKKKTQTEAGRSGTQVKTNQSDLAQGQMPARDYGSDAATDALAGKQYMIRRDETLWGIAARSRPEGTSVHQTMLDIQRLNPNAFIDGNINRIKAGYIIYLPGSGDISSDDVGQAMEEVSQQNQDWRDGVASQSRSAGPSLRISTDSEPATAVADSTAQSLVSAGSDSTASSQEGLDNNTEMTERLVAMEAQLETLQRIVTLKDDQIAALQNALSESESAERQSEVALATLPADIAAVEAQPIPEKSALELAREAAREKAAAQEQVIEKSAAPSPVVAAPRAPAPAVAEESSNIFSYLIGVVVLAALALFFFLRRRKDDDAEPEAPSAATRPDVFADVQLPDAGVELHTDEEPSQRGSERVEAELTETLVGGQHGFEVEPEPQSGPKMDNRGYGERKHDEYASDDAGDALAEADIYIAYGRYPQAIDLLKTAITNEPDNAEYHLKLVELYAEMGEKEEAAAELEKLRSIGDAGILSRAEGILQSSGSDKNWPVEVIEEFVAPPLEETGQLDDLDLIADTGADLEADFGDLEIELGDTDAIEDDLDLSEDFTKPQPEASEEEEDLVFAEGGDEMSTKLDLARAYLDMGDEDGARQILNEVAGQGSAEQKEEAKVLLERLD